MAYQNNYAYQTYPCDTPAMSDSSSDQTACFRPVTVEVQPPKVVQKGTKMYPPLVLSLEAQPNEHYVFQVMARDKNGSLTNPWNSAYYTSSQGLAANGEYLSRSSNRIYAVFPDIKFTVARKFTLVVTLLVTDASGIPFVGDHSDTWTSPNTAPEIEVKVIHPKKELGTKSEQKLLKKLGDRGFDVPVAPS